MRAPSERVLFGDLRLHTCLERQRRQSITAWAEGPGKRHSPISKGLKARNICGSSDVPVLQTGACMGMPVPSPSGWAAILPRCWRLGWQSGFLPHGMGDWVETPAPNGTSVSVTRYLRYPAIHGLFQLAMGGWTSRPMLATLCNSPAGRNFLNSELTQSRGDT